MFRLNVPGAGRGDNGLPEDTIALCRAIVEDPQVAQEFELEPRTAIELLCIVLFPWPQELDELTSLIS